MGGKSKGKGMRPQVFTLPWGISWGAFGHSAAATACACCTSQTTTPPRLTAAPNVFLLSVRHIITNGEQINMVASECSEASSDQVLFTLQQDAVKLHVNVLLAHSSYNCVQQLLEKSKP